MKPPARTRSAPLRYEEESGCRARVSPWRPREKLLLLRALKEQRQRKEPDVQALQALLPHKSQAQIVGFIHLLKGRVAREAVQKDYRCQQEKRFKETQVLAPIEVWTELAEKVSFNLEDAITAAFSQILTIAATEPISLLHSVPSKPTRTTGKKIINSSAARCPGDSSSPLSRNIPEPTTSSHEAKDAGVSGTSQSQEAVSATAEEEITSPGSEEFNVDFEKIYKYLSALTRGGKMPELSSCESAVILDLLMSLPDELIQLDCASLRTHMYQSFNQLNAPWPRQEGPETGPGQEESASTIPPVDSPRDSYPGGNPDIIAEDQIKSNEQGRDCTSEGEKQNRAPISLSANQICTESTRIQNKGSQWKELGVCPLNSFLIPIKLLSQTVKNEAYKI
ncbi:snRNA-activating protein complex subunit 2 [Microcaecilia unicolor]|uniref:snRNA-activating protein complex subunit 2 n=1 Tax=Microcaecilia unicolor TaxID=1415580 RepID=A0A6P7WP16_9AMPH|nr:snRNA-activating protein complex subunit 2 [Microcaecilia unicolor]